jgi:Tfp pilus assembly protein PilF
MFAKYYSHVSRTFENAHWKEMPGQFDFMKHIASKMLALTQNYAEEMKKYFDEYISKHTSARRLHLCKRLYFLWVL